MSALRDLDQLYLVGGFSRSPLLKSMAREELQRVTRCVVDVHEPDLAILRGAVMYPSMSTVFNSRKARLAYGVNDSLEFDGTNPEHVERHTAGKTTLIGNTVYVSGCFSALVNVVDDIPGDAVMTSRSYTPVSETDTTSTFGIYATSARRSRFADEPGIFIVGEVTIDLDMTKPTAEERSFRVQITFGGTQLTARVLDDASGEEIRDAVLNIWRAP